VIEAAGDDETGERSQPCQAAFAFIFMQARMAEPRRRMPTDRAPLVLALGDVHGAVDQHGKAQACTGAKLQHAHATLNAVGEFEQTHTRKLRQHARMSGHVTT
jgi:hypothetical protein